MSAKPPLHVLLRESRIEGRKTWGLYVGLMTEIRKTSAVEREQRIIELRQRVERRALPP